MNWFFTFSIISIFYSFPALFVPQVSTNMVNQPLEEQCEETENSSNVVGDDLTIEIIAPRQTQVACSDTFKLENIEVEITNLGSNPQSNFVVSFWMSYVGTVIDTFPGTILPGETVPFTYDSVVTMLPNQGYWLVTWTDLATDSVKSNDTTATGLDLVTPNTIISPPYHQDFENFNPCTGNNCGNVICDLSEGWSTATNNFVDNMDFRIRSGTTPTGNTGPTTDYYPGNAGGKYLHTEANGCHWRRAHLISPCIDVPVGSDPQLTFMYHMYGNNIGWISVEIYDGNIWHEEVIPTVYWNQGNIWKKATLDLTAWIGQTINVRIQGITGGGNRSDLAIDDIRIQDFNIGNDVSVAIAAPVGTAVSCGNSIVQVALTNEGINPQSNFDVSYQRWDDVIVTETYTGTLNQGETDIFVFSTPQAFSNGMDTVRAWISLSSDAFVANDTALSVFENIIQSSVTLGWTDNLETQNTCSTNSNCATTCSLTNWINSSTDDIDWRVDINGTPTGNSGPSEDHNPGNTVGKYLYLESSSCYFATANLISPCLDLPADSVVEFSFWYHMRGFAMGELHVDLFDGVNWIEDIEPPVVGEQGDQWYKYSVNLSLWAGQTVNIRVRGVTGYWYASDLAIDDFSLHTISERPEADFSSDLENTCVYGSVKFRDDTDFPMDWSWSMSPNTYQFINGTNANSKNPEVIFTVPGKYEVQLISNNTNGGDTIIKSDFLTIHEIYGTPQMEDYTIPFNGTFPPFDWSIDNPDQIIGWSDKMVTGQNNAPTNAAYMDNYNYNAPDEEEEDRFNSLTVELANSTQPTLSFDVAYAKYNNDFTDSLRIDISTDCGVTFPFTIFQKGGSDLATAPDNTTDWQPSNALEWRTETIDLSDFIGESIVVSFVNINGFGNNIYVDNFMVFDPQSAPVADFVISDPACSHETTITDNSFNSNTYEWDFGIDAMPSTSNTVGPHAIIYATSGQKTIQLIVGNAYGIDTVIYQIDVAELPIADFSFNLGANGTVQFNNQSTNAETYLWDFGNGNTSTVSSPAHKFDSLGTYTVILHATNSCGTVSDSMTIIPTNTNNLDIPNLLVNVFPNPNQGTFNLSIEGAKEDLTISILDIQGRILQTETYSNTSSSFQETIEVSNISDGVYILRVQTKDKVKNLRLVIQD